MPPMQGQNKTTMNGVTFYGSFIYWHPHEDGLEFAATGFSQWPSNNKPPSRQGQMFRPDFDYSPGFRLGASYESTHHWGFNTMWTCLHSNADRDVISQPFGSVPGNHDMDLYAVWSAIGGGYGAINSGAAHLNLKYNLVELTGSVSLFPIKNFTVRPSFGLMGVSINQTYRIQYVSNAGLNTESILIRNNFNGGGFRGILDLLWDINRYFEIFGRIGGSLALGKFRLLETQFATPDQVLLYGRFLNVGNRFWSIKPEIDFSLGMEGSIPIFNDRSELKLAVAWDFFLWLDQNQMMKFYGPDLYDFYRQGFAQPYKGHFNTQHGDLSLQGLTVTAGWEF
jgi:hypothetical protein